MNIMAGPYICPKCLHNFSRSNRLQSHLNRKKPCVEVSTPQKQPDPIICTYCQKPFARKDNLLAHLKNNRCPQFNIEAKLLTLEKKLTEKDKQITEKDKQIAELIEKNPLSDQSPTLSEKVATLVKEMADLKTDIKENPRINNQINNQILQVVCVGQNDNYLDMLTQQLGDFDKALEYIKDCALSDLSGDCKLIGKMYLNGETVQFTDKNRTKITYYNENKEKIVDSKELFGKKIANNLQNSYLKGVNHLINQNLENRRCPNKFLEEYDLQTWNQHIYSLSDIKYQKQLVNHLDIPVRSRNS